MLEKLKLNYLCLFDVIKLMYKTLNGFLLKMEATDSNLSIYFKRQK